MSTAKRAKQVAKRKSKGHSRSTTNVRNMRSVGNKYELGQIYTPPELVSEILNKFPTDMFADATKTFMDPACGDGAFLVKVFDRFMVLLEEEIPDREERKAVILEGCIFGIDIDPVAVRQCIANLGAEEYNHNIICANALDIDINSKYGAFTKFINHANRTWRVERMPLYVYTPYTLMLHQNLLVKLQGKTRQELMEMWNTYQNPVIGGIIIPMGDAEKFMEEEMYNKKAA